MRFTQTVSVTDVELCALQGPRLDKYQGSEASSAERRTRTEGT